MRKLDLHEFIQPGNLVFDVGANIGSKTAEYLDCGATVVCFEPNYSAVVHLLQKFANHPKVFIETVGLYKQETVLEFYAAKLTAQSTFCASQISDNLEFVRDPKRIHVTTLDRMFAVYGIPSFLKIDVEAFEIFVLKGMSIPVPTLSFEFNPNPPTNENYERCLERLVSLGYSRFNYIINYTVDGVGVESNEYRFDDWVNVEVLLAGLREEPRQFGMNWGDIYARFE